MVNYTLKDTTLYLSRKFLYTLPNVAAEVANLMSIAPANVTFGARILCEL